MTRQRKGGKLISVSPVIGAGLTIAGWVVVVNVGGQLLAGLAQSLLCEIRSRRPLECLPAWSAFGEIGRRSTDTLLALVVHSPADSAAAAIGGLAGGMMANRRRTKSAPRHGRLCGPTEIVPLPSADENRDDADDPDPA